MRSKTIWPNKDATFFIFRNDILLYGLTSITYFEGRLAHNPQKLNAVTRRDHRPDCKQLCIGLVVNREGFLLGYESLAGKTRDAATLWPMLDTLEAAFQPAPLASSALTAAWPPRPTCNACGKANVSTFVPTRRAVVRQHLPAIRSQAWTIVRTTHRPRADHRRSRSCRPPDPCSARCRNAVAPRRRLPSQGTANVPGSPRQSPSAFDEAASPSCRRHVHDQGRHLGQGQKSGSAAPTIYVRHLLLHAATHGDRQGIAGPRERRGDSG